MNKAICATLAIVLGSPLALSTAYGYETAEDQFTQGITAFRTENYREAVRAFEQAKKAGLRRPALDYNLGVCYFRLGEYSKASTAFRSAAEHKPLAAISHYNLGLVERKQGHQEQAHRWFRIAANESSDPRLRALAEQQISDLNAPPQSPWVGGVLAAVGYDDNLLDPTKQAGSSKGSTFGNVLVYGSGIINGSYENGWRLDLSGYFSRYTSQSYFDMNMYQAGIVKVQQWAQWATEFGGQFEHDTLGGSDYLNTVSFLAGGSKPINEQLQLRLRYRYSNINALATAFDPLQGSRQEARIQLEDHNDTRRIRVGYDLELNNRNDFSSGGNFTSYSATRHTIFTGGEIGLQGAWRIGGELSYRLSHYNDANRTAGVPGQTVRDDKRLMGTVRLVRKMSDKLKLQGEYSYTDNSSNIGSYSYKRNVYSVGVNYVF